MSFALTRRLLALVLGLGGMALIIGGILLLVDPSWVDPGFLPGLRQAQGFSSNVQIVLDRSTGMEDPFGSGTKLESAVRDINLQILTTPLVSSANLAFRQYGGPCESDNTQLVVDFGQENQQEISRVLSNIGSMGDATLANGVVQAIRDFGQLDRGGTTHNEILVIAGGDDACGLAEVEPLLRQEIQQVRLPITVRFVGLGISPEKQGWLDTIATALSGELPFYANDPIELQETLAQVAAAIQSSIARDLELYTALNTNTPTPGSSQSSNGSSDSESAEGRPPTGIIMFNFGSGGRAKLVIKNGELRDAVVALTTPGSNTMAAAYIRSGDLQRIDGIPGGDYYLYFSTGDDWDNQQQRFTYNQSYRRFENALHFQSGILEATSWQVFLGTVPGGTVTTDKVDPEDFPSFKQGELR